MVFRRLLVLLMMLALLISFAVPALAADYTIERSPETDAERLLRGWDSEAGYVYMEFGRYPFERDGTVKPCLWRVLALENGCVFLLNEYVVDNFRFHTEKVDQPDWPDYELYTTMNTIMLDTMFTPEEQAALHDIGNRGRLFILDNKEFMTNKYGFRAILTKPEAERICWGTPYGISRGVFVNRSDGSNGAAWYWSRTCRHTAAGGYEHIIGYNGHISMAGFLREGGVRPACFVDMTMLDHVSGSGTLEDPYRFELVNP